MVTDLQMSMVTNRAKAEQHEELLTHFFPRKLIKTISTFNQLEENNQDSNFFRNENKEMTVLSRPTKKEHSIPATQYGP